MEFFFLNNSFLIGDNTTKNQVVISQRIFVSCVFRGQHW
jgi:hypothetical protein